jgi:hypothetical protein
MRQYGGMTTPGDPLPLAQVSDEDVEEGVYSQREVTPGNAWGAAHLFWQALDDPAHYATALKNLSAEPGEWGDYSEASALLKDLSIMSEVETPPTRTDVAHVKFIELAGEASAQAFAEAPLDDVWVLTLVKPSGSDWWLVWSLDHNAFPDESVVPSL